MTVTDRAVRTDEQRRAIAKRHAATLAADHEFVAAVKASVERVQRGEVETLTLEALFDYLTKFHGPEE